MIQSDPLRVRIGPEAVEYVEAAAKQLRASEPPKDLTIEGRVVLLKSDSAPWEDEADDHHTIVIAWLDANGKPVKTRIILQPTDYLLACDAHKGGKTVSVKGMLERRGRYTRLANPTAFRWGSQMSLLDDLDSAPRAFEAWSLESVGDSCGFDYLWAANFLRRTYCQLPMPVRTRLVVQCRVLESLPRPGTVFHKGSFVRRDNRNEKMGFTWV